MRKHPLFQEIPVSSSLWGELLQLLLDWSWAECDLGVTQLFGLIAVTNAVTFFETSVNPWLMGLSRNLSIPPQATSIHAPQRPLRVLGRFYNYSGFSTILP